MELTLRQYYIGKALQGYMSNHEVMDEYKEQHINNIICFVDSLMDALTENETIPEQEVFQNYDRIPIGYFAERLRRLSSKSMATRFMNACAYFDINTIGELVKFKSTQFMRGRNIGRTMIEAIGCVLQEYGIENW